MVFAPHPDDEVLGCGGTIALHRRTDATVKVVFMTDGRSSHRALLDSVWLATIRQREAYAACEALGIEAANVFWLGFEDGRLRNAFRPAVAQVGALLAEHTPNAILIPFKHEDPPDHRATRAIVLKAVRCLGAAVNVYEYPIWFWHHWPQVPIAGASRTERCLVLRRSLVAWFGLRMLTGFNCRVPIADVLPQKRAALASHASQMTRLTHDPRWATLEDVSRGRFLACFFRAYEPFHAYHIKGSR